MLSYIYYTVLLELAAAQAAQCPKLVQGQALGLSIAIGFIPALAEEWRSKGNSICGP